MRKKILLITFLLTTIILITSCNSGKYYVSKTEDSLTIYESPSSEYISQSYSIPSGESFIFRKQRKRYTNIQYKGLSGYVYRKKFKRVRKYNPFTDFSITKPSKDIKFNTLAKSPSSKLYNHYPSTTSTSNDGNYSSRYSGSGKTVNVKGYYRKNGTYVRPHTRSTPRRR